MGSRTWSASAAYLVLWCTCVSVCGSPLPVSTSIGKNVSEAIAELAVNCTTNPLLKAKNIAVCDNPHDLKVRAKCLGFLDVNRRLCALNSIAGFNLADRLRVEEAKQLTVDMLCNNEKAFTFASLPEFPDYDKSFKQAFMVQNHCITMCSSDVFLDDSPNYFCKAMYYGSVIIQNVRAEIENSIKDAKPLKMNGPVSLNQEATPTPDQVKPVDEHAPEVATSDIHQKVINDVQNAKTEQELVKTPELNGNSAGTGTGAAMAPIQNAHDNKVDSIVPPAKSDPLSAKPNEEKLHNAQDDKAPETVELKPPTADKELPDVDVAKQAEKNTGTLVEAKTTVKPVSSPEKPIDPAVSVDKPEIGLGPDQDDYGFSRKFHPVPAFQGKSKAILRAQNKEYQHYPIRPIVDPALSTKSFESRVNYSHPQSGWETIENFLQTSERKPMPTVQIITLTGLRTIDDVQLKEYQHYFLMPIFETDKSEMSTVSNVDSTKVQNLQQTKEDIFKTYEMIATTNALVLYNHTINSLAQIGNTPEVITLNSEDQIDHGMSAWRDSQLPGIDDAPILEDGNTDDEERPIKKADTSLPERIPNRQFVSNIGPDEYMDDEDGHFFPLFFSAVVMMALLYILYHNKNKIMGLLIEGRQAGSRRRNSRGHSYRRLDTLEQAISSNAPGVAPSKIIY